MADEHPIHNIIEQVDKLRNNGRQCKGKEKFSDGSGFQFFFCGIVHVTSFFPMKKGRAATARPLAQIRDETAVPCFQISL
jgi:hypothetical protein